MRTLPWVRGVHERYGDKGLVVIGVHSPEFGFEKKRSAVEAEVEKHGLRYSNYLDTNLAYWDALGNHYWPTTYLIDKCGKIRSRHIGEVHAGQKSGDELEKEIDALLAESNCSGQ